MINKINTSVYLKHVALLLTISILFMSFKTHKMEDVILTSGTSIPLETISNIESSTASVGQIVDFRVRYDVKINGKIVVATGAVAKGQILRAQKAKGLGKEGFLEIQIKSVTAVDGQEIPLSGGNLNQEGEDRQTLSIVLGILVCILFLTMKGKNVTVPAGYQVSSMVATNTTVKI